MTKKEREKIAREALMLYMAGVPSGQIMEKLSIARATFYRWLNKGYLTDGVPWYTAREAKDDLVLREAKKKEIEQTAESNENFFNGALDDVKEVYRSLINRLKTDDTVQVSINDMKILLSLAAVLDNRGAEQMAWMEQFLTDVAQIAIEIMDERQFALFKTRMIQLVNKEKAKMDPIAKNRLLKHSKGGSATHNFVSR